MGEDYLDVPWDEVEDEAEKIEAHLHLLLGGRDRLAVGHALGRYIRKTFPGLDILRAGRIEEVVKMADQLLFEVGSLKADHPLDAALKLRLAYSIHEIKLALGPFPS